MRFKNTQIGTALPLALCIVVTTALPHGYAQQMLAQFTAQRGYDGSDDGFGSQVSFIGDVDGDGVVDVVVAAQSEGEDANGNDSYRGAVYLISGATNTILQKSVGDNDGDRWGMQVAGGADFDGDGVNDYLAGSPEYPSGTGTGRVVVYSGATGNALYTFDGELGGEYFGRSISVLGDVNGDGRPDFGVGAPAYVNGRKGGAGRVYVYSGKTGKRIRTITGTKRNQYCGTISGLGDLDGDGHADYGVGSYGPSAGPNGEGTFDVYSGATGTVLYSLVGEAANDRFGDSRTGLGDLNGDGIPDFVVAAVDHINSAGVRGRVYVYSGPTGALLYQYDGTMPNEAFGDVLPTQGAIDFNHDGYADIVIGSGWIDPTTHFGVSVLYVYSGRTGKLLYTNLDAPANQNTDGRWWALSTVGDFNHDGIDDLLSGAQLYTNPYADEGCAYIFAGNDLFLQANADSYSAGDPITLDVRGGEPNALTMIVATDVSGTSMFLPIVITSLDADGNYELSDTVPDGLSGLSVTLIAYATRPGRHGLADSDFITIDFL